MKMSQGELIEEIEHLRSKLYFLTQYGAGYDEVLNVSQELDKLIVAYHHFTA